MNEATEPTAEGVKRYPHTQGFNTELVESIPCVCQPTCAPRCAGECGCEACSVQFTVFCDLAGFYDADPGSRQEAQALTAYRAMFGVARAPQE
jgi:hypothetical protein